MSSSNSTSSGELEPSDNKNEQLRRHLASSVRAWLDSYKGNEQLVDEHTTLGFLAEDLSSTIALNVFLMVLPFINNEAEENPLIRAKKMWVKISRNGTEMQHPFVVLQVREDVTAQNLIADPISTQELINLSNLDIQVNPGQGRVYPTDINIGFNSSAITTFPDIVI